MKLDKQLHFLWCFFIFACASAVCNVYMAAVISMCAGVLKELWDKADYGLFCWYDLLADAAGITAGILVELGRGWI